VACGQIVKSTLSWTLQGSRA